MRCLHRGSCAVERGLSDAEPLVRLRTFVLTNVESVQSTPGHCLEIVQDKQLVNSQ